MNLFGHLDENTFLIFSRQNRHLYAYLVREIYRQYYGTSHLQIVIRGELIDFIASELHKNPNLWVEDEELNELPPPPQRRGRKRRIRQYKSEHENAVLSQASHVYARLMKTGWLEEEPYGFNTRVEMPPAVMVLVERLDAIETGLSTMFGGVIVTIRNNLRILESDARESALGLQEAAEIAIGFSRKLRMIYSSLRSIEKVIMSAENLEDRLHTFFEDFIKGVLIQDFKSLLTSNHPFRFKVEIIDQAQKLLDQDSIRVSVVDAYLMHGVTQDKEQAYRLYNQHLQNIIVVFEEVDTYFEELMSFQRRLENRLSNTIRYMERSDISIVSTLVKTIQKIDELENVSNALKKEYDLPPSYVTSFDNNMCEEALFEPHKQRKPLEPRTIHRTKPDPAIALQRLLMREFEELFQVTDNQVRRFMERHVPPGSTIEARHIAIECLEDFLAFEEARKYRFRMPKSIASVFEITEADGFHDCEWIRCRNFSVYRKTDTITFSE